jgi:hypothetical protein
MDEAGFDDQRQAPAHEFRSVDDRKDETTKRRRCTEATPCAGDGKTRTDDDDPGSGVEKATDVDIWIADSQKAVLEFIEGSSWDAWLRYLEMFSAQKENKPWSDMTQVEQREVSMKWLTDTYKHIPAAGMDALTHALVSKSLLDASSDSHRATSADGDAHSIDSWCLTVSMSNAAVVGEVEVSPLMTGRQALTHVAAAFSESPARCMLVRGTSLLLAREPLVDQGFFKDACVTLVKLTEPISHDGVLECDSCFFRRFCHYGYSLLPGGVREPVVAFCEPCGAQRVDDSSNDDVDDERFTTSEESLARPP